MPTKKRRIGFIPRSDVLGLINKLSCECNLSYSKIINMLVEEALYKRGMFNIKTGRAINDYQNKTIDNGNASNGDEISGDYTNGLPKVDFSSINNVSLDKEIYAKFLVFLQFQERMKKGI